MSLAGVLSSTSSGIFQVRIILRIVSSLSKGLHTQKAYTLTGTSSPNPHSYATYLELIPVESPVNYHNLG